MGAKRIFGQSDAEKYELIRSAITHRKPISAVYNGKQRLLCPHQLGLNDQGEHQALFYQFGGESLSRPIKRDGSPDNWRCLALSKLFAIQAIDGSWHTAPHTPQIQNCVRTVEHEVPGPRLQSE